MKVTVIKQYYPQSIENFGFGKCFILEKDSDQVWMNVKMPVEDVSGIYAVSLITGEVKKFWFKDKVYPVETQLMVYDAND